MCKNQRPYGILYDIAEGGNFIGAAGSRSKKTGESEAVCAAENWEKRNGNVS